MWRFSFLPSNLRGDGVIFFDGMAPAKVARIRANNLHSCIAAGPFNELSEHVGYLNCTTVRLVPRSTHQIPRASDTEQLSRNLSSYRNTYSRLLGLVELVSIDLPLDRVPNAGLPFPLLRGRPRSIATC